MYVPQELRGVQDMRFTDYVKSLMGIVSQYRYEMVWSYLMPFVLHCIKDPEYLRQPQFDNVKVRTDFWKVMVN